MENNSKRKVTLKKLTETNNALQESHISEIEIEKKTTNEELERSKRYLIEEVRHDGDDLINEIDRKYKKSVWSKILDFIFK